MKSKLPARWRSARLLKPFATAATVLALAFAFAAATADAAIVGWNVYGSGPNGGSSLLQPTDEAGAPGYRQTHWNNHLANGQGPATGTLPFALVDDSGAASGVSLSGWTVTAANGYANGNFGTTDQKLMNVFTGNSPVLTFSGLDTFAPDGYSVLVYFGRPGTGAASADLVVNGDTQTISFGPAAAFTPNGYVLNTGNGVGNYAIFDDVSGDTLTIDFSAAPGSLGITAVQIVQAVPVPEPGSLALLAVGSVWLLRRRRARAAG